ncbi:MAG: hypothetical protein FWB90_10625, partial [Fibromonadales bacterium]|nr:hypothetical protein [Fibromonadales bacterium]
IATGTQLGGGVSSMALDEKNQILYASVYASYGNVPVKPVTLSNKTIGAALPSITDSFGGLLLDSETNRLFIADAEDLKIYDTASKQIIAVSANALPPVSLAIARW